MYVLLKGAQHTEGLVGSSRTSRHLHLAMHAEAMRPHWPLLLVRLRQACSALVHLARQVAWA